jgi:DNA-binding response OmpR family regulator
MSSENKNSKTNDLRKIIILDDDEFGSKILVDRLKKRGIEAESVTDVEDLYLRLEEDVFGLLLLDILMPKISGIDVLIKLRLSYKPVELPIVMFSSDSGFEKVVECLTLGANDYLVKPVNLSIASARISGLLDLSQFYRDSLKAREYEAIYAMVGTYNHEIRNPLTIAFGYLDKFKDCEDQKSFEKLKNALNRITDITNKIGDLSQNDIEYENYGDESKIIKLHKK